MGANLLLGARLRPIGVLRIVTFWGCRLVPLFLSVWIESFHFDCVTLPTTGFEILKN